MKYMDLRVKLLVASHGQMREIGDALIHVINRLKTDTVKISYYDTSRTNFE